MKKLSRSVVKVLGLCLFMATACWSQTITSIDVTPANASVPESVTQQYTAIATLNDGSTREVTSFANWSSSSGKVASAGTNGIVTTKAAGSATITATLGTIQGATRLTVTSAVLTKITVSPAAVTIGAGYQIQFFAR